MENGFFRGFPGGAQKSADRMLALAHEGSIKQHLMGDTSQIRHGVAEDKSSDHYCNFLKTKLCHEIMRLEGEAHHE